MVMTTADRKTAPGDTSSSFLCCPGDDDNIINACFADTPLCNAVKRIFRPGHCVMIAISGLCV